MADYNEVFKEVEVEWQGRTLVLRRPNLATEGAYCRFCKKMALRDINANRRDMGEDGYKEALAAWQRDCGTGNYSWQSKAIQESLRNEEWFKEALYYLLTQHEDQRDLTREGIEALWREKSQELVDGWNEVTSPNPTTPQSGAVVGASDLTTTKSLPA